MILLIVLNRYIAFFGAVLKWDDFALKNARKSAKLHFLLQAAICAGFRLSAETGLD
jgi:hypothetical protein